MLKMNKKKNPKETHEEKDELLTKDELQPADKEAQEESEKPSVNEEAKETEKKEPSLQEKFDELNDRFLRLHAEFDNYRKRVIKERVEYTKFASEDVITSMLPVIDDLERAIKSMEGAADIQSASEGVTLIYNKFKNILTLKGIEEIKTVGEAFSTDFHEAVSNVPAETEDMKGKVIDVVEKGYLLNGKVIRFAKVVVGN
jgi:molecular chaperone GrpE